MILGSDDGGDGGGGDDDEGHEGKGIWLEIEEVEMEKACVLKVTAVYDLQISVYLDWGNSS